MVILSRGGRGNAFSRQQIKLRSNIAWVELLCPIAQIISSYPLKLNQGSKTQLTYYDKAADLIFEIQKVHFVHLNIISFEVVGNQNEKEFGS